MLESYWNKSSTEYNLSGLGLKNLFPSTMTECSKGPNKASKNLPKVSAMEEASGTCVKCKQPKVSQLQAAKKPHSHLSVCPAPTANRWAETRGEVERTSGTPPPATGKIAHPIATGQAWGQKEWVFLVGLKEKVGLPTEKSQEVDENKTNLAWMFIILSPGFPASECFWKDSIQGCLGTKGLDTEEPDSAFLVWP